MLDLLGSAHVLKIDYKRTQTRDSRAPGTAGSILTSCMEKNGRAEREKLPRGQHTLRRVIMLIFHYRVPRRTAQPSADRRIHEYDYT